MGATYPFLSSSSKLHIIVHLFLSCVEIPLCQLRHVGSVSSLGSISGLVPGSEPSQIAPRDRRTCWQPGRFCACSAWCMSLLLVRSEERRVGKECRSRW